MPALTRLDHVNVRTVNLDVMRAWYCDVLGLTDGYRPDFRFPGAWLYIGDHPVVHLVEIDRPRAGHEPRIEHFAFSAAGLCEFLENLTRRGIDYRPARIPEIGALQVNIHDPDGNRIHVDFPADEADAAGF